MLTLVFAFRSANALAYAFGTAVTGTITITTLLFFWIVRHRWRKPLWLVIAGAVPLLTVDLLFFAANLTKITHGAWLPILIALATYTVFTTWQKGRELVTSRRRREEGSLHAFIEKLHKLDPPLPRCVGTAVFLNRGKATVPLAMRANVEHNHVLHAQVVILSVETVPRPHVPDDRRIEVDDLGYADDGISYVSARFGYMDSPNLPALLPLINESAIESPLDEKNVSYFLSRIELHRSDAPGMSRWRKNLFLATSRLTADAAEYFHLPPDRTVIVGSRIEL